MSLDKKQQHLRKRSEAQALLKQEIIVNQEILSQLSQQEYLLLIGEIEMKEQLESEMKMLKEQQKKIQKERKGLTLETDPLDPLDDIDAEILFLFDTCTALYEKIGKQKKRNQTLSEMIRTEGAIDCSNQAVQSRLIYDTKRNKPLLITLDYPDEDE